MVSSSELAAHKAGELLTVRAPQACVRHATEYKEMRMRMKDLMRVVFDLVRYVMLRIEMLKRRHA